MADFYEIDFLPVGATKSGDAISLRYEEGGRFAVHVVDGGYQDDGQNTLNHLKEFYGHQNRDGDPVIDHVVATHPDGDHASGLQTILENAVVCALWMNRPWIYAPELLPRFANYTNVESLARALRTAFPRLAKLEEIAVARGIPIQEAFQGAQIGAFTVLAPSRSSFLDYVVEDERTPEAVVSARAEVGFADVLVRSLTEVARVISAAWGVERFPPDDTSPRNNMSIVQHARLSGDDVLLTADVGRAGLDQAADYAAFIGVALPLPTGSVVQVPHHGSRHNVSSETLDRWLGAKDPVHTEERYRAVVSAGKDDVDHPRKAVVRAFIHRGARISVTRGMKICSHGGAAPARGWTSAPALPYPEGNEE